MRFCTIGLVTWFATWYTAEVLHGQTQNPRTTSSAEVRVIEERPSLFEGAGQRIPRSQSYVEASESTHGGSPDPIVAPAVAFEIRSPGAIRMAVANEGASGRDTNPIRRVRLEEPTAKLARTTTLPATKSRTAGGVWMAQTEQQPRSGQTDLLNELLDLPDETQPEAESGQPPAPAEPTAPPPTPEFSTPESLKPDDALGDLKDLDRLPESLSPDDATPAADPAGPVPSSAVPDDVVPSDVVPGPLESAADDIAPEPSNFPLEEDLPTEKELPPLDRGRLDIDFPPADTASEDGAADDDVRRQRTPEQAASERQRSVPPEPSKSLVDGQPSEPRRLHRSGMDPDYLNPKPQSAMGAPTLSALLHDPADMPDPCEPMRCQQMWDCAGGRHQSRSALMMRNWARNYQVIWSNRCNQCGGYTCGDGNTGARNLCGPAFGSMCGVGLWRDGCGHHGRHGLVTCSGGTVGCTGECGAPGCSTIGASCSGGCASGNCQHGSTVSGLQPCHCGQHHEQNAPWRAWDLLWGAHDPRIQIGGWTSAGYHSRANGLFNDHPHRFNVHQSALYIERATDTSRGGIDFGFRFDVMYGADAQNTQAFGNTPGTWDFVNGFDHGIFGWALPQAYVELAAGDVSLMVGHFYTIMGYEVVPAPDNFFYSHAMTMNLSEPFTHTGALASWTPSEFLTWYSGWTLGWDTGFDELNGSNSYLGGFRFELLDFLSASYTTSFGDFGRRGSGYAHSVVLSTQLPNQWAYVLQSDVLRVGDEDNVGVNQYLFYDLSPRIGLGARLEWWKGDRVTRYAPYGSTLPGSGSFSYYGATFGANFRIGSNLVVRPESRLDWSPGLDYSRGTGAIDMVMSY